MPGHIRYCAVVPCTSNVTAGYLSPIVRFILAGAAFANDVAAARRRDIILFCASFENHLPICPLCPST